MDLPTTVQQSQPQSHKMDQTHMIIIAVVILIIVILAWAWYECKLPDAVPAMLRRKKCPTTAVAGGSSAKSSFQHLPY